jgi:N utilization substance protein A
VGARGSRVRQVVNELRGEKVDIVEWRDDTRQFIAEALSPAKVRQVILDEEARQAIVVVPDHQLSLAIGKEGQNARLAARLSGYRVDIRSETEQAGGPPAETEGGAGKATVPAPSAEGDEPAPEAPAAAVEAGEEAAEPGDDAGGEGEGEVGEEGEAEDDEDDGEKG